MSVQVGPPVITIHADEEFLVCRLDGSVQPEAQQGYFVRDTRLVSSYAPTLSGTPLVLMNSAVVQPFSARFEYSNGPVGTARNEIPPQTLHLRLDRTISAGVHEDYELTNYGREAVELDLELRIESDFADLFDVKQARLVRRGTLHALWQPQEPTLTTVYEHGDFRRGIRLQIDKNDSDPGYANGMLFFRVRVEPRGCWRTCLLWRPLLEHHEMERPAYGCHALVGGNTPRDRQRRQWMERVTRVSTNDPSINTALERAVDDLAAMRIRRHDVGRMDDGEEGWVPAAGIPWFVSLFGRDILIVALQTLSLSSHFALAALQALSRWQGDRYDERRDMQPGKVLHELRVGELAHFRLIPHTPYYGTHDATTLFVWTASEVWRWVGDRQLLERLRPHVDRALEWIDRDGDMDGDGLQEYETRAGAWGMFNQGWKDSGDAIVHADGSFPELPIALCELQAYVVAAKRGWAQVLEECFDDPEGARVLRDASDRLVEQMDQRLWWPEEGTYYLGLDGRKRPIASVASNAGHLLWAGAVTPERAASVVRRLMAADMWTGWGVRTLSSDHPAYNPFSYQCGSVWPHDSAILASGFLRYGHREAAWRIARALFDAAVRFQYYRLPEVFAGLERDAAGFPVQYQGANVPQAWAAGAPVHLLTAMLGLEPSAAEERMTVSPALPPWLTEVRISGLRVGQAQADLEVTVEGVRSEVRGKLDLQARLDARTDAALPFQS
jgi:glycogen debranching enzyme